MPLFVNNADFNKNQIQNAVLQPLATPPADPVEGQFYYDSSGGGKVGKLWNGTAWISMASADLSGYSLVGHTHVAANITNFDTQVRTSRLDQMAAPTASVSLNSQKITGLATPTADTDAATKAYVDLARSGIDLKDSVRAATTANISLTGTQTIDGVAVIAGDRVLVKNQTTASQNGIYVVAAGAWSRATDADSNSEVTAGMTTFVSEGTTLGNTRWSLTTDDAITLGTTSLTFAQDGSVASYSGSNVNTAGTGVFKQVNGTVFEFRGINAGSNKVSVTLEAGTNEIDLDVVEANLTHDNIGGTLGITKGGTGQTTAAAARTALGATTKFSANVGNGSSTSIAVTHNLNTQDVTVTVREAAGSFNVVYPDIRITDANNVTLVFAVAPTSNQYRCTVVG